MKLSIRSCLLLYFLLLLPLIMSNCTSMRNTLADLITPAPLRDMLESIPYFICDNLGVVTDRSNVNEYVILKAAIIGVSCKKELNELRIPCGISCDGLPVAVEALKLKTGETFYFTATKLLNESQGVIDNDVDKIYMVTSINRQGGR